jgi:4-methyl-5(b-hydroxyethyl)-thiazole monophosphate biosynthesis
VQISSKKKEHKMQTPKIIVPIAEGTEEMEAIIIIDILRRAEFNVVCAAVGNSKTITASRKVILTADTLWDQINPADFDAIVLPGGAVGTDNLMQSQSLLKALQEYNQQEKFIGAICAGPLVLQAAGILQNRTVTCHPAVSEQLTVPEYSNNRVVHSENIITSQGPGTAMEFALAIITKLTDKTTAEKITPGLIMP